MKNILITGGTGSLGKHCIKKLLKKDISKIIIFSRDERKQSYLSNFFNSKKIKFIIGDIRNIFSLEKLFNEEYIDTIIHTAAMKHVPICEKNIWECIQTNLIGTQNLIQCSLKNDIKRFVAISTDKSSNPYNIYGYSKYLMEKLVCSIENNKNYKYFCVRPGNLIGSSGSVIHIFKKQIENNKSITITDPKMERFFITLDDVVSLIFNSFKIAINGDIFIPYMKSTLIKDLAHVILQRNKKNKSIKIIGSRLGERLHESIISKEESSRVIPYMNKGYYILKRDKVNILENKEINTFNSKKLSYKEISNLLDKMNKEEKNRLV